MKRLISVLLLTGSTFLLGSYEKNLNERMSLIEAKYEKRFDKEYLSDFDMKEASQEALEPWDKELNIIYQLLMKKLSKEEQTQLRTRQRAWIKERDKEAEEASSFHKGGTAESMVYVGVLLSYTKDRTIELARMYDVIN